MKPVHLLLAILAVLLAVGGGYYAFENSKPNSDQTAQTATPKSDSDARKDNALPNNVDVAVQAPENAEAAETPAASPANEEEVETTAIIAPTFDVVRVEKSGDALFAGQAAPNSMITIENRGEVIAEAKADTSGAFVAIPNSPLAGGDNEVVLRSVDNEGRSQESKQVVAIAVSGEETPLVVVVEVGKPANIIQKPEIEIAAIPAQEAKTPEPGSQPEPEQTTSTEEIVVPETEVAAAPELASEPTPEPAPQPEVVEEVVVASAPEPAPAPEPTSARDPVVAEENVVEDNRPVATDVATATAPETTKAEANEPAAAQEEVANEEVAQGPTVEETPTPEIVVIEQVEAPASTTPAPVSNAVTSSAEATPPSVTVEATSVPEAETASEPVPQAAATVVAKVEPEIIEQSTPEPAPVATIVKVKKELKVSVEAVETEGEKIFVAGSGTPEETVRVYVNENLLGDVTSDGGGRWLLEDIRKLAPGTYSIRADLLEENGQVKARAEVPFVVADNRPTEIKPIDTSLGRRVIIRKNDNLWTISRRLYGDGRRFTSIYAQNRDQIRNPHLIFPGQVFELPGDALAPLQGPGSPEKKG